MKKHFSGLLAVLIAVLMMGMAFTGCVEANVTSDTAMVFMDESVNADEARLYVYTTQLDIEKQNEWMVMLYYGDYETFWKTASSEGMTYAQLGHETAISRMVQTKTLVAYANDNNITLSSDEEGRAITSGAEYKTENGPVIDKAQPSDALLTKFFKENALANKAYLQIVSGISTSFSDEENAANQRKSGEGVSIYAKGSYTASDEEGAESIEVSEEDQKKNREEAIADILSRVEAGEAIADIVADYKENHREMTIGNLGEISADPSNQIAEGANYTSYSQYLWEMKTDEKRSCEVTGESSGVTTGYVLHCIDEDDAELRKAAEEEVLNERRMTMFQEEYPKIVKKYSKYHVYNTVTDNIRIEEPLYGSDIAAPTESASEGEEGAESESESESGAEE